MHFYHDSIHFKAFGAKSIQALTGVIDKKLAAKIYQMLDDLVSSQKEKMQIDSIPFKSL